MADIRSVTADFAVAPQLEPADMARAARSGFKLVINNRPDGEAPDQPTSEEMKLAAEAAGLGYAHIPVRGGPTTAEIEAVGRLVDGANGPVLAFCRSGTRSIITWSLGRAESGTERGDLIDLARDAGYDVSGVLS